MPHRIRLFAEQTAYLAAGGQVSSAGVFLRDYRGGGRVLIPFAALGFEKFVSDYRPGAKYEPRLVTHELALSHRPDGRYLPTAF